MEQWGQWLNLNSDSLTRLLLSATLMNSHYNAPRLNSIIRTVPITFSSSERNYFSYATKASGNRDTSASRRLQLAPIVDWSRFWWFQWTNTWERNSPTSLESFKMRSKMKCDEVSSYLRQVWVVSLVIGVTCRITENKFCHLTEVWNKGLKGVRSPVLKNNTWLKSVWSQTFR